MNAAAPSPQHPSVLQVGPLKSSLAQVLADDYAARVLPDEPSKREAFLSSHGGEITAVVTSGRTGVDAELMAALPNLGAVVNFGVGYDTTDVDAAAARGIAVSSTPDVLNDCVADTAVGLMIDTLRQFPHVASGTVQTRAAMEELTLRNLDAFLESGHLVTPVMEPGVRA
jgi:lactate dehydrogenase-like 2-hydroxyacid dehydrogenase